MVDVRKQCVGHPRKHNGGWRNEQLTCAILHCGWRNEQLTYAILHCGWRNEQLTYAILHCGWRNEQLTYAILIHISYTTITMPLKPCEHAPLQVPF